MKKIIFSFLITFIVFTSLYTQNRYQATWESLKNYNVADWVQDAKFGVFIHWGVYSVPAFGNEWYPRNMYLKGSKEYEHHLKTYGPQNMYGYKDFIPLFKAEKFNADAWVDLFKRSGFKYVVPVAEHHDGFAMYKTALSKWNAYDMGPRRDIIGELATATRKAGLVFGLSSHRIEHWWFMNSGQRYDTDVNSGKFDDLYGPARAQNETISPEFMNDWLMRNIELVNNYQPQLFWFDWWIEQAAMEPYRKSFASYYYNKGLEWNKGVVINYKNESFPGNSAVLDIERGKLTGIREHAWQTDDAVGYKSWGYIENDSFKSAKYLVNNLIDIVSKNGHLLLNIGPKSDGTIPDEVQKILLEVGSWLSINGDAIYGTRPWKVFGEGPTKVAGGSFSDAKDKPFTANDIRFTKKGDFIYVISMDNPVSDLNIRSLPIESGQKIISIELLGSAAKVVWTQSPNGLNIKPNTTYPSKLAVAYKIKFE
ncbi:MAG: alpha-L-fucosidase [Saprospiraceae bacterium]